MVQMAVVKPRVGNHLGETLAVGTCWQCRFDTWRALEAAGFLRLGELSPGFGNGWCHLVVSVAGRRGLLAFFFFFLTSCIFETRTRDTKCLQGVQFSSVIPSCLTATPRTAARQASLSITNSRSLPKFMVGDAIQPPHPLSSPSPALNLSQHESLFKWVSSLHQVARVLEFQLQHQSFQWTPRTDLF